MKAIRTAKLTRCLILISAAVGSSTLHAAEHRARPPRPPLGIEKALLDAELAQQLSQRTGHAAETLRQRFANERPHEVVQALGLSRADMQAAHCDAVKVLRARHQLAGEGCEPVRSSRPDGERRGGSREGQPPQR